MTDYTELLDAITGHGNLSLACRELGIAKSTFLDAVSVDEGLADQYTRAKAVGYDTLADDTVTNASALTGDPALKRLAFDASRWYLGKLAAKKYGDKVALTGDADGDAIKHEMVVKFV